MPIYEYRCQSCGHELEAMQRITADPLTRCPACSQEALKKLISQTSFQLKGSGWYVTDYKGKKAASDKGSEGESKPAKSESSPAKSESTTSTAPASAD